jgi:hypothetical protein
MYAVDPATLMGVFVVIDSMVSNAERHAHRIPGIAHPATKGWMLHMLREATGTQDASATWLGGEWRLYGWIGASALGRFAIEGEALSAALLAVWGQA